MNLAFLKTGLGRRALFAVLALALLASVVTGREKPALEVLAHEAVPAQAAASDGIDLAKLERPALQAPHADPFARRSFAVPTQVASVEAAKPAAPPLPFRYMGRLTENGKTEVYVLRGDDIINIAAGRRIDAEYRVDAITDSSIRFTYLPLRLKQSLDLAELSG
jgi:hypothetical protein